MGIQSQLYRATISRGWLTSSKITIGSLTIVTWTTEVIIVTLIVVVIVAIDVKLIIKRWRNERWAATVVVSLRRG